MTQQLPSQGLKIFDSDVFDLNMSWRGLRINTMCNALSDPINREACKADALWAQAFEEGVRWVAPIQASSRRVTEDTEIRGYFIPKGDIVMTSQASACHDEELYDEPEKYNIFRPKIPHQAFGNGPHFCQGTHIARRMLANIMLPMLFDRFPDMTLPEPEKVEFTGFGFRGPRALHVTLN
mgnify:CR=1 FL=1